MKNLNVTKAGNKNKKMPMNFGPVDNIRFFVYIYIFFFFSSIEMQDVKNGSMPFNQVKNNKERERERERERENTSINYE